MKRMLFALALLLLGPLPALAQYPEKPVRVIVGAAPGGTLDLVMRIVADSFQKKTGQRMLIENRPGAFGWLTVDAVIGSNPDGYTLGTVTPGALDAMRSGGNLEGYKKVTFLGGIATFPLIFVVSTGAFSSLRELLDSNPAAYGYSNTIGKLGGKNFLDAVHLQKPPEAVYYTGKEPQMFLDLIAGRIAYAVATAPSARGFIEGGQLKAIAVAARQRSSLLKNTPTLAEALQETGISDAGKIREPLLGLIGPANMPANIKTTLIGVINNVLDQPDVQRSFHKIWAERAHWSQDEFEEYAVGQ